VTVDLGGGDVGVSQHLLHRREVSPFAYHVGSKAVAQSTGGHLDVQFGRFAIALQYLPEALSGESLPQAIEEQSFFFPIACQVGSPLLQVGTHSSNRFRRKGDISCLGMPSPATDVALLEVYIIQVE